MSLEIQSQVDLLPYNTFHVSCIAEHFVVIRSGEEFQELLQTSVYTQATHKLILGGGSNMLLARDHFDGLVIKNEILGKEILEQTFADVTIDVGAGENRNELVRRTLQQGRIGLENLISIPGTVGAAPVQNIGAYGAEIQEHLVSVTGVHLTTGTVHTLTKEACHFSYRDSIFKHELKDIFFITSVRFTLPIYDTKSYQPNLSYGDVEAKVTELQDVYRELTLPTLVATAVSQIRAAKLPDRKKIGTAGSFFQNPIVNQSQYDTLLNSYPDLKGRPMDTVSSDISGANLQTSSIKLSGGQLIELAGLKGYEQNGVGTYEKHALVLVNHSSTRGADLLALIQLIQKKVDDAFHVSLYPEVIIIS